MVQFGREITFRLSFGWRGSGSWDGAQMMSYQIKLFK